MTGRYQAYPEYKDSGVEWLGEIPAHWKILQIKHLSCVKRGASPRPIEDPKYFDEDGEYVWTRIADVTASDVYLTEAPQRLSDLGSSLSVKLQPGSLFLSIAGTVGKPCLTGIKACIHDGFVYFPELKIHSKYLYYVFAAGQAYRGLGKFGTQLNLNTDTVGGIKAGLPNEGEISKIIDFLDHETAKIDTLIEKQQKLIALLKEKRQAVISHAVTKGLNPDAPMKDSGVEWLGDVPAHWLIKKLKYQTNILPSNVDKKSKPGEDPIQLCNYTDVYYNDLIRPSQNFMKASATRDQIIKFTLRACDTIITKDSEDTNDIAVPAYVPETIKDVICGYHLALIRPFVPRYGAFIKRNFETSYAKSYFGTMANGLTRYGLGTYALANAFFVQPPLKEAVAIAAFLDHETAKIDTLIEKTQQSIDLSKERRTALISAAVTGKIDVRNWQPPPTHKETQ